MNVPAASVLKTPVTRFVVESLSNALAANMPISTPMGVMAAKVASRAHCAPSFNSAPCVLTMSAKAADPLWQRMPSRTTMMAMTCASSPSDTPAITEWIDSSMSSM